MTPDERKLWSPERTGWPLAIKITSERDSVQVALEGKIDLATADEVSAAIRAAARLGLKLVVDLSEVSFIDSMGLRALLQLISHGELGGGQLSFIPSKHDSVNRLLATTGISELLS